MADSNSTSKGELKRLRDVCRIVSGGTPSKANCAYWSGTIPWVTARDLKSFEVKSSTFKLTPEGASRLPLAPAGSVLVLVRGMQLLKSFPVAFLKVDSTFNQDVRALIPGEAMRGRYLAWQLCARESQILQLVDIAGHGTGRLAGDLLRELRVTVPPLDTQDRAIESLDSLDESQRAVGELILVKRQFRSGLMQALFTGQRRFPEFAGRAWRDLRLGELFDERDESGRSDLPLLAITGGRGVIARDDLVRRDSSAADKSKYKRIAPGDIGYNTMRMWQGVSGLSRLEGIVSPAYTVVTPRRDQILPEFAAHLFKTPLVIHRFLRLSQGLVADTLNLKYPIFARVRVSLPPIAEQRRIASALDAVDAEIDVLVRLERQLGIQKVSLMDRLLGGTDTP